MDISFRLSTNDQVVDQLRADKVAEERRPQSPSLTCATPGTSSERTRRRQMTGPRHADIKAVTNISDAVRVKLASHMRGTPVLELPTTDEDCGPEEKVTTPSPKKRAIKSGKILRADTSVL